jgi:hypothetical protein
VVDGKEGSGWKETRRRVAMSWVTCIISIGPHLQEDLQYGGGNMPLYEVLWSARLYLYFEAFLMNLLVHHEKFPSRYGNHEDLLS